MAITTMDQLVAAMAGSRRVPAFKVAATSTAGACVSLFRVAGSPQGGAAPTAPSGAALSRSTQGALPILAPSGTSYLTGFSGCSTTVAAYLLCDRLVETGGLSGTVTTAQTINSVALPARASAEIDVELWLEVYASVSNNTVFSPITYTNQAGVTGRIAATNQTLVNAGATPNVTTRCILQAGDTGVQSVQSIQLASSTGTAGNFGIVLRRTLAVGYVTSTATGWSLDWAGTDMEIIPDDACLEVVALTNGSNTGVLTAQVSVSQG